MNYIRGLSVTALATGLTFALGLANQALLARVLGDEGRGILAAVATTVLLATLALNGYIEVARMLQAITRSDLLRC